MKEQRKEDYEKKRKSQYDSDESDRIINIPVRS